jgi:hypothetical protein
MQLNEAQEKALRQLYDGNPDGSTNYEDFQKRVFPLLGEPEVAMLRYCGMVVGIEPDGYTHS